MKRALVAGLLALAVSLIPAATPAHAADCGIVSTGVQKANSPHTYQITFTAPGTQADNYGIIQLQAQELYNARIVDTRLEGGQTVRGYYFGPGANGTPQEYSLVDNYTVFFTALRNNDRIYTAFRVYVQRANGQPCTQDFAYWAK